MDFQEWLKKQAKDSGQKIKDSTAFAGILSEDYLEDPICALQIGFAVLMDKPIILIVDDQIKVPNHLVKIAKRIERVRKNNPSDMERAKESIVATLKEIK